MKKLFVIDFDRTLLKTNSILLLITKLKIPSLYIYAGLRKLRVISKKDFAYKVTLIVLKYKKEHGVKKIVNILFDFVNSDVLNHIRENQDSNSKVIIISTSPHDYITCIAEKLGFQGFGSSIEGSRFHYLYGKNKIELLKNEFPEDKYEYYYAISDHISDLELLDKFQYKFIVNKNGFIYER